MKIILPYLVLVSIVVVLVLGFLFVKNKGVQSVNPVKKLDLVSGCRLSMDQKYFPSAILEYKFSGTAGDQDVLGSTYNEKGIKGDQNAELVLTLRPYDKLYVDSDSYSAENIRNQNLTKKALRHEATDEELSELRRAMDKVFIGSEEISGLPVLIFSYPNAEPASTNVQYLDKASGVVFTLGLVKENLNYQPYFEDWAKKVC